jgi:MATE family multidrug resistance protein
VTAAAPEPTPAPAGIRLEAGRLLRLAVPVAAAQLATMLMGVVDTLMLGRFHVEALAAASIANVWIFGTLNFAVGILMGLDPLVSQAHGAGDGRRAARALQRGLVMAGLLTPPLAGLWWVCEPVLLATGQLPGLAAQAHTYTLVQIPSIPFFLAYMALRQYLQGRELVRPALWVILVANLANAALNAVLIFGLLGAPRLGILGAGIATASTRVLTCVGLVLWVRAFRLHEGAWTPWSRAALAPAGLLGLLALGVPVAIQMCLEIWAFLATTLIAGHLGAAALAAQTVVMNVVALTFMVPLGISQGAAVRVGNLLGAGRRQAAQRAAWVATALGGGVMAVAGGGLVALRHGIPRLWTEDLAVVGLAAAVLPVVAAFQVFDGVQAVACGVLRGMGRPRPAAVANLVGYWGLALPVGGWLALRSGLGLVGIWTGMLLGLTVVAASLVAWIARHGPARIEPHTGAHAEAA